MKPFTDLGALVEQRWRHQNYNENLFPEIAAQALSEANLCEHVDPWSIIRWVHETPTLPVQMDLQAKFSNPPITLYVGPRFYIDAYYWLDGTTTIHQHAFSGAFQVLHGSSIHTSYRFDVKREINPQLIIGTLLYRDASLLKRGDIREINPGPEFIHSLFHLERPSVTITIRTYKSADFTRQYSYLKPHLGINSFFVDVILTRRVQTVSLLLRMKHPEADQLIGELIDASDFQTAYAVLREAFDFLCHRELEEIVGITRSQDRFEALFERARRKHGELLELLKPVFEEEWRQTEIIRRRAEIKNEDHRFLMALMLNVPDKIRILELVKQRFPKEESIDLMIDWFRQLAATKTFGSREPSVLGSTEFTEEHFYVLKGLLQGQGIDEIKAGAEVLSGGLNQTIEQITSELETLPMLQAVLAGTNHRPKH